MSAPEMTEEGRLAAEHTRASQRLTQAKGADGKASWQAATHPHDPAREARAAETRAELLAAHDDEQRAADALSEKMKPLTHPHLVRNADDRRSKPE